MSYIVGVEDVLGEVENMFFPANTVEGPAVMTKPIPLTETGLLLTMYAAALGVQMAGRLTPLTARVPVGAALNSKMLG